MEKEFDEQGRELNDTTPVAVPLGYTVPETLEQVVARLVRDEEFRKHLTNQDAETFEEADDFDVGDDYDPKSPFELDQEQERRPWSFREEVPNGAVAKDKGGPDSGTDSSKVDTKSAVSVGPESSVSVGTGEVVRGSGLK